jgi:hypothetical protein
VCVCVCVCVCLGTCLVCVCARTHARLTRASLVCSQRAGRTRDDGIETTMTDCGGGLQ